MFVVEKEDKNLAYVTDGYHIILALSSSRKNEVYHLAKNAPKTNFYKFCEKTQWFINYNSEHPCPDVRELGPYNPFFYLKELEFAQKKTKGSNSEDVGPVYDDDDSEWKMEKEEKLMQFK